jgi:hypothetical protein
MAQDDNTLDTCHCCDTPHAADLHNDPGRPALAYRVGTWASFVESMKVALAAPGPLTALTTRAPDDPAMAILDAWAVVGDILTFYQERLANEGFLRTATQRRSVLELARAIGYELNPGVAASTYLAYTVDTPIVTGAGLPMPTEITLPAGTRVQSVPAANQTPQSFESLADTEARVAWNQMLPKTTQRQRMQISSGQLQLIDPVTGAAAEAASMVLSGTGTNLRVGDMVVVEIDGTNAQQADPISISTGVVCLFVTAITVDYNAKTTTISFETDPPATLPTFGFPATGLPTGLVDTAVLSDGMTPANVRTYVMGQSWSEEDLANWLLVQGWDTTQLTTMVASLLATDPVPLSIWGMRMRTGVFGHSSPPYASLARAYSGGNPATPPWDDWENNTVWTTSDQTLYSKKYNVDLFLDRLISTVAKNGWLVLQATGTTSLKYGPHLKKGQKQKAKAKYGYYGISTVESMLTPYRVLGVSESSLADFSISGKATGARLGDAITKTRITIDSSDPEPAFGMRNTSVFVQSEALAVAESPISEALAAGSTEIILDRMVLGLYEGQLVALTGTVIDPATQQSTGKTACEVRTVVSAQHEYGYTIVGFAEALANTYVRSTVSMNGNVATASHGATISNEIVGSGNGALANQIFTLKAAPLTYVSASTPSGAASTLTIRVGGVAWTEVSSLYQAAPTDRVFITRRQDDGTTLVMFGDGVNGARLPSGNSNITATYRTGIGAVGQVDAQRIQMLQSKPLGLKSATNPEASTGAADPEVLADARINAPRTVRTLDRLVSLDDFTDFARGFAGIGKALATPVWSGQQQIVHITIGAATGGALSEDSQPYLNLKAGIAAASDGRHAVDIRSYLPAYFRVTANLVVDPTYVATTVQKTVVKALIAAFAYNTRDFTEAVSEAELMNLMQSTAGVIAVEISELYRTDQVAGLSSVLASNGPVFTGGSPLVTPAELLLLHPAGPTITTSTPT